MCEPASRNATTTAFFVYGTLKRGQCRDSLWPIEPLRIEPSWTHGMLFGRHDYPAMVEGNDRVLGERWVYSEPDVPRVLETLDRIEGCNQPGTTDLYSRVVLKTWNLQGNDPLNAYAYHYATEPGTDGFVRLKSAGSGEFVSWPAGWTGERGRVDC